jgi:hypothetical protein
LDGEADFLKERILGIEVLAEGQTITRMKTSFPPVTQTCSVDEGHTRPRIRTLRWFSGGLQLHTLAHRRSMASCAKRRMTRSEKIEKTFDERPVGMIAATPGAGFRLNPSRCKRGDQSDRLSARAFAPVLAFGAPAWPIHSRLTHAGQPTYRGCCSTPISH